MLSPRTKLDPEGYYQRLGLQPSASRADIIAAFRAKARVLHPDVPKTGNEGAFVAAKQAYDILSNQQRRGAYDRKAREAVQHAAKPAAAVVMKPAYPPATGPNRRPRFSDLPIALWVGFAALLVLGVYQATVHVLAPSRAVRDDIKPNAATVAPLSPSAHQAVLYGPAPLRLAGVPNFYVSPAADPAVLWRWDSQRNGLVPLGQLPPFSAVQAVRLVRENGMLEVLLNDHASGFIRADHLTPGNMVAARQAYCGYNAGPTPHDGELLEQQGHGGGRLEVDNRAVEPAVIKLRDIKGKVVLSVFLEPGGQVALEGLPEGIYHTEFATGELWSRGCNSFVAGMQARQMETVLRLPGDSRLVVAPDADKPAATDIPAQTFEQDPDGLANRP